MSDTSKEATPERCLRELTLGEAGRTFFVDPECDEADRADVLALNAANAGQLKEQGSGKRIPGYVCGLCGEICLATINRRMIADGSTVQNLQVVGYATKKCPNLK